MAGVQIVDENGISNFVDNNGASGFVDQDGDLFDIGTGGGSVTGTLAVIEASDISNIGAASVTPPIVFLMGQACL